MAIEIYKRGQGKNTRLWSGFALGTISVFGCYRLYLKLSSTVDDLVVQMMVPVCVFIVIAAFLFWLANKPSLYWERQICSSVRCSRGCWGRDGVVKMGFNVNRACY